MNKQLQSNYNAQQHILSKDFEIFYYEDSEPNRVKNHEHNYYEFYFFLQGDVSIHIAGHPFYLSPGDIIVIPPCMPHFHENHSLSILHKRIIFWVSQDYFSSLCTQSPNYEYITNYAKTNKKYIYSDNSILGNDIQAILLTLLKEIHSERFGREAQLSLLVNNLLLKLNRMAHEQNVPNIQHQNHHLYENLLLYIELHLNEDLTLDNLSDTFFVSKYHIAHIFKENLGISIHQYIIKKRLSKCRDALLTDANISDIYQLYGFKDYSSFFRAFKKEYGLSPKKYKNKYKILSHC